MLDADDYDSVEGTDSDIDSNPKLETIPEEEENGEEDGHDLQTHWNYY
jgi:hypothetical protein